MYKPLSTVWGLDNNIFQLWYMYLQVSHPSPSWCTSKSILYICHCILFELLNIYYMEVCCTLGFLLFGIVSSSQSKVTIDRTKSSWHQAKHQCNRRGGDVLTVKSKEKLRRVMEVLQDTGDNETFWIGASERRRRWFWSHSKSMRMYAKLKN